MNRQHCTLWKNVLICERLYCRILATTEGKARILEVTTPASCWWPTVETAIRVVISHHEICDLVPRWRCRYDIVYFSFHHWALVSLSFDFDWLPCLCSKVGERALTLKVPRKMHLKMSSAEGVCCKKLPNITDQLGIEGNSVDPEQTAPIGAV